MFRTLLMSAVVAASAVGCASSHARPDAQAANAAQPCSQATGSRVPDNAGDCTSFAPIRTYSQQDMERTGQTTAGNALQLLDPSITVHH